MVMTVKLNDDSWDVEVEDGRLVFLSDLDALQQYIRQRLLLFKGEYFLDKNRGVDYENILGAKKMPEDSEFITVIEGAGFGTKVTEFTKELVSRELIITFSCTCDYGQLANIEVTL